MIKSEELLERIKVLEKQVKLNNDILVYVAMELGWKTSGNFRDYITHFRPGMKLSFLPRIEKIEAILEVDKYKQTYVKESSK